MQCSTVNRPICDVIYDEKCSANYEDKCFTEYVDECRSVCPPNSISFSFLFVKKSLMCLEGKSMTL